MNKEATVTVCKPAGSPATSSSRLPASSSSRATVSIELPESIPEITLVVLRIVHRAKHAQRGMEHAAWERHETDENTPNSTGEKRATNAVKRSRSRLIVSVLVSPAATQSM
ncbi:hypothetical protein HPB50_021398 [Hyalomma asiaticum]|uniref:Uncharacterized protein n=1 Tax=Hyalomma asiaticum TaxID=266040 RepID=A0ACB7RKB7_HYAAI|nr:hypothetical protein HPB50_021398 [Hyalomma asiaticum]